MHDVNPVGEEIGDLAAAEIEIGPPVVELVRVEGAVFGRAEPLLPIQAGGLLSEVRLAQVGAIAVPVGPDEGELADLAAVEKFALRLGVVRAAALLKADLKDALVGLDGFDDIVALLPLIGERLLAVNIFARLASI